MKHIVHVEKRSSSSGSCEEGRGVGEDPSKKKPRVIGPTMPPQARRDVSQQVCHVYRCTLVVAVHVHGTPHVQLDCTRFLATHSF